jgi:hypothetical protein
LHIFNGLDSEAFKEGREEWEKEGRAVAKKLFQKVKERFSCGQTL